MVLVRGDLDFNLISIRTDDEGRYIVLEAEVQRADSLLVNVYVPNKVEGENSAGLLKIWIRQSMMLLKIMNLSLWWVGTLMLRLRESGIDCSGGNPAQKTSVKSIQDLCLDFDLVDKGRILLGKETHLFK